MRILRHTIFLLPLLMAPTLASAVACSNQPAVQPLPVRSTLVPPIAHGFAGSPIKSVSPHVLLAESRDESLALDVVLLRLRLESCTKDAYAGYKPRTQFDNTPWRFNSAPGTKFTAAEFDAWMKSRGVTVAKGNPAAAGGGAAVPAVAAPADASKAVGE